MASDSCSELVFDEEVFEKFRDSMQTIKTVNLSQWLSQIFSNVLADQKRRWKTYKKLVTKVPEDTFDMIFNEIKSLCESDLKFCEVSSFVFSHLVVFHFEHFVNGLVRTLLDSDNDNDLLLCVSLVLPVLDPCSGFMCWAPKFLPEFEGRASMDFFSAESLDLQTPFGVCLTKLRRMIYEKSLELLNSVQPDGHSKKSVFVSSFLSTVIGMMAPTRYRKYNISCGFPHRIEILIAISNYQRVKSFVREKSQHVHSVLSGVVASWSEVYSQLTNLAPTMQYKNLDMMATEDVHDNVLIAFLKLIGFTNPGVTYQFDKSIGRHIMNLVLNNDASLSSFAIVWAQSLMMIDSSIVFYVFDEIFALLTSTRRTKLERFHTLVHCLSRFVDVLSCLPERYLTESQCLDLHSFSLVTLCVPHPRVRKTGYKLAVALDRYEAEVEGANTVIKFIRAHSDDIERHMLALFEAFPAVDLWKDPLDSLSIVQLLEVMVSHDEVLWQIMLSAFFTCAASFFSQTFMTNFRRMALSLVKGWVNSDDEMCTRLFTLNVLTSLGALGQKPLMFSNHTNIEEANVSRQQSQLIIEYILRELQQYIHICYPNVRIMMSTVAASLFSDFVPRLLECTSVECIVIAMRGIAWNVDFCAVFQNDDFRVEFCRMYAECSKRLLQLNLTPAEVVVQLSKEWIDSIASNSQVVRDFLVVTYRLLHAMKHRFAQCPKAPFPSCELTLITDQDFIRTMQKVFPFIVACCLYPVTDDVSDRLHYYALHDLSVYFACCPLENPSLLTNQTFLDMVYKFSETVNGILFNLLNHNLVYLLPVYLQKSVMSGGTKFFKALCSYFRIPKPQTVTIAETLLQQWESIHMDTSDRNFRDAVNVLYEEGGNLIAACLFHLALTDKQVRDSAFILLGSICPVLLTYNCPHPGDKLVRLFQNFIHYSRQSQTIESVSGISHMIVARMSFCLEQVIDRLFDAFVDLPIELTERVFFVMFPLIEAIGLDLENRVVSSQTELTFMRFSCCSFVERLVKLLLPLDVAAEESLILSIWPSLAIRSGFEFVLLTLIASAQSTPELHKPVIAVISALYRADPSSVLDCLTKHLSFLFWLNETIRTPLTHKTMLKEMLSKDDTDDNDHSLQYIFVMQVLVRWAICCGDVQIARTAVAAYSGFLDPVDNVLVGLFARVLWILSTALSHVTASDPLYDTVPYVEYIAEVLGALYHIAEFKLNQKDTSVAIAVFWIASDCLRCYQHVYEPIFNAALRVIILFMEHSYVFTLLKDPSAPFEAWYFTQNVFSKYHKPWMEEFHGYLPLICSYRGTNVPLCIKAINMLVISGYPALLTQKDNCMYIILVLLMPWMWKVVMTDMSRFMFTSEDVELMDSTVETLKLSLSDDAIRDGLEHIIESGDISSYSTVQDVFREALKHIELDDIPMIMKFYTEMLAHGDKHMRLPLYVLTTLVIEAIPESVKYLKEFTMITQAAHDKKRQYHRNYLAAVKERVAAAKYIETESIETRNVFPLFPVMEHIVVVDIPHLYEFDEAAEMTATSDSLNSFLPICPVDTCFVGVPIMQKIRNVLERLELPPFKEWSNQIGKGMTFLFADRNTGNKNITLEHVSFKSYIPKSTANFSRQVSNDTMLSIFLRPNEDTNPEDFLIIGQPTDLVVITPNAFVPSFDDIDVFGQELFD